MEAPRDKAVRCPYCRCRERGMDSPRSSTALIRPFSKIKWSNESMLQQYSREQVRSNSIGNCLDKNRSTQMPLSHCFFFLRACGQHFGQLQGMFGGGNPHPGVQEAGFKGAGRVQAGLFLFGPAVTFRAKNDRAFDGLVLGQDFIPAGGKQNVVRVTKEEMGVLAACSRTNRAWASLFRHQGIVRQSWPSPQISGSAFCGFNPVPFGGRHEGFEMFAGIEPG